MSLLQVISHKDRSKFIEKGSGLKFRDVEYDRELSSYVFKYFEKSRAKKGYYPNARALQELLKLGDRGNLGLEEEREMVDADLPPSIDDVERARQSGRPAPQWVPDSELPIFIKMCAFFASLQFCTEGMFEDKGVIGSLARGLALKKTFDDFKPRATNNLGKWRSYNGSMGREFVFYNAEDESKYSTPLVEFGEYRVAMLSWYSSVSSGRGLGNFEAIIPNSIADGIYDFGSSEPGRRNPDLMVQFMTNVHPLTPIHDVTCDPQPRYLRVRSLGNLNAIQRIYWTQAFTDRKIIAIAGEKGTGKSVLTRRLRDHRHFVIDSDDWGRAVALYLDLCAQRPLDKKEDVWDEVMEMAVTDTLPEELVSEFKRMAITFAASPSKQSEHVIPPSGKVNKLARNHAFMTHYQRTLSDKICGFREFTSRMISSFRLDDEESKVFVLTHTSDEAAMVLGVGADHCLRSAVNGEVAIRSRKPQDSIGPRDIEAELVLHAFYKSLINQQRPLSVCQILHKLDIYPDWNVPKVDLLAEVDEAKFTTALSSSNPIFAKDIRGATTDAQRHSLLHMLRSIDRAKKCLPMVRESLRSEVSSNLDGYRNFLTTLEGAEAYFKYCAGDVDKFVSVTRKFGSTLFVDEALNLKFSDITQAMFATYVLVRTAVKVINLDQLKVLDLHVYMQSHRYDWYPDIPGRSHLKFMPLVFGQDQS